MSTAEQIIEYSIDPRKVISIKLLLEEKHKLFFTNCVSFTHLCYKSLNPDLYKEIQAIRRWDEIEIKCEICPTGYENGIFGFAVALGQQENKIGNTVIVQNDIQLVIEPDNIGKNFKATILTIIKDVDNNTKPLLVFALNRQLSLKK